ncbi:hypothetical protein TIFTF001_020551 [Ficus carica]|uniref:Uncharacterized protein n=1 Tax=Ficus carica TaxID=3494 RepID=A0AA88ADX9_FICCA|nr:hypothetical protein TIFTF001_020551 [Ficus carica]
MNRGLPFKPDHRTFLGSFFVVGIAPCGAHLGATVARHVATLDWIAGNQGEASGAPGMRVGQRIGESEGAHEQPWMRAHANQQDVALGSRSSNLYAGLSALLSTRVMVRSGMQSDGHDGNLAGVFSLHAWALPAPSLI